MAGTSTRTKDSVTSGCTDDSQAQGWNLLQSFQTELYAEILSYVITSTADIARFRLISSHWNKAVLPFALKSCGFIRNCYHNDKFINKLVTFGEETYPTHIMNMSDLDINTLRAEGTQDAGIIESLILVESGYESTFEVDMNKASGNIHTSFPVLVNKLYETKSFPEFQQAGKEAIENGMFLSVETFRDNSRKKFKGEVVPDRPMEDVINAAAIVVQKVPRKSCTFDASATYPTVLFYSHDDNDGNEDDFVLLPFDRKGSFRGYVVEDIEKMDRDEESEVTCLIPLMIHLGYDFFYDVDGDILELYGLWSKTQEQTLVPEGIALADGVIPISLHDNLMKQIDDLRDSTDADYHPHSNNIVRDIVHPALYSYIKGVSTTIEVPPVVPAKFAQVSDEYHSDTSTSNRDYWGREYEESKYQWLPTYFSIGLDGTCNIDDYINNLVPRTKYEPLYCSLAHLFSHALPMIESVFSYGRSVRPRIRYEEDMEMDYDDSPVEPIKEVYHPLRGQRVQVITKIVDYELQPGQTYEGVWHVEGMSHEEIVATAIYFIHRDDDIVGGDLLFKRAFHEDEANFIFSRVDQCRPDHLERIIAEGLLPLGKVQTLPRRLVVFPNSHVHKVTKLENQATTIANDTNSSNSVQRRRIVVFFIVNPEKRIMSSREVPPQQMECGGSLSREEAMEHRLELMKERKFTKQDWNVRDIELCEH